MADSTDRIERDTPATPTPSVRDKRVPPRGALPRQLQTWLMVAVAAVILIIIAITGHQAPATRPVTADRVAKPALAPTDRIKNFERQLTDDEIRQRQLATTASPDRPALDTLPSTGSAPRESSNPRAGESSPSADNVAFSRRTGASATTGRGDPSASQTADAFTQTLSAGLAALDPLMRSLTAGGPGRQGLPVAPPAPMPAPPTPTRTIADEPRVVADPPAGSARLLEGTVIEAVLVNRLDGTYVGPVIGLVTTPVYSQNHQQIVIPAGARVVGVAGAVLSVGDTRLAVTFHRLVMPDGRTFSLDRFKGLSQVGETGLRDQVNRHYVQVFGASLAVGALSALAQLPTHSGVTTSFADTAGQGAGSSLATSAAHILDHFLNVLPTVTIREGYRLKVYLTSDLDLPVYAPVSGGVR